MFPAVEWVNIRLIHNLRLILWEDVGKLKIFLCSVFNGFSFVCLILI